MDYFAKTFSSLGIGAGEFVKGDQIDTDPGFPLIWQVYKGTVRKDGSQCTLFEYSESTFPGLNKLAENMARTLKKLRLPGLPKILGTEVTSKSFVIALEPIIPLSKVLENFTSQLNVKWGLGSVLTTLKHLHDAKCVVGNVHLGTVWVNTRGEWVLTGFEIASFPNETMYSYGSMLPDNNIKPPEIVRNGWTAASETIDSYQFGQLIKTLSKDPALLKTAQQLSSARRPTVAQINPVEFDTPLRHIDESLANMLMFNDFEFEKTLRLIQQHKADFEPQYIIGRILPVLIEAHTKSAKGGIELIRVILELCEYLQQEDDAVANLIVSLFGQMDRAIRFELLTKMKLYIQVIPDKLVQRNILPAMGTSFGDSEPMMRKESLESVLTLAPRLSSRQINSDLLKLLAKTNSDPEASLRARTVNILSNLATIMDAYTRSTVIVTALAKSLKDSAPEVRTAALHGLLLTADSFSAKESAEKLLGPAATAMLDGQHEVRALGRQIVQKLLETIMQKSTEMDTSLEGGAPLPERVIPSRNSVSKLFGSATPQPEDASSKPPPVPKEPVMRSPAVPSPAIGSAVSAFPTAPNSGGVVTETAVFGASAWDDDWDDEEPEPKAPAKAGKKRDDLDPQSDLEPVDDEEEDGWGEW